MNQANDDSKKSFFRTVPGTIIVYVLIFFVTWFILYIYFNYTPNIKDKVCFRTFGITFGCNNPLIMQRGNYYEANTVIKLSDEFLLDGGKEAKFYVKENGKYVETVTFTSEGVLPVELYVDYNGRMIKHDMLIYIGDAQPPEATQKEIPKVKINEVIVFEDYLELKDNRDPNPFVITNSIVAEEVGTFNVEILISDNHNNIKRVPFSYEVIA